MGGVKGRYTVPLCSFQENISEINNLNIFVNRLI